MKKAWLAMMLPDNRHARQVSVSRLSARPSLPFTLDEHAL
jgi:hypothetical protein